MEDPRTQAVSRLPNLSNEMKSLLMDDRLTNIVSKSKSEFFALLDQVQRDVAARPTKECPIAESWGVIKGLSEIRNVILLVDKLQTEIEKLGE